MGECEDPLLAGEQRPQPERKRIKRRLCQACCATTLVALSMASVWAYHDPFISRKAEQLLPIAVGVTAARLRGVRVPLVVEHPKCGRTWLKCILGSLLLERLDGETPTQLHDAEIANIMESATNRVLWKHGRASFDQRSTPETIESSTELAWRYALVHGILLVRDPRDTIVSSFYQIKYRQNRNHLVSADATLSEYMYQDFASLQTYVAFLNEWAEFLDGRASFGWMSVRYEDLRDESTAMAALRRIANHMNLRQSDEELQAAMNRCGFDNMKEDAETNKAVRKGEVAGYLTELSPEDVACLDRYICTHLSGAAAARWGYATVDCSTPEIAACHRFGQRDMPEAEPSKVVERRWCAKDAARQRIPGVDFSFFWP